jgi:hypothetical protein
VTTFLQSIVDAALGNTWYLKQPDVHRKTIRRLPDGRVACGDKGGPVRSCAVAADKPGEVRRVKFEDLSEDDQAKVLALMG